MPNTFLIVFSDGKRLRIKDVIDFEEKQIVEVQQIAKKYTKAKLQDKNTKGEDLSYLTDEQKEKVIEAKDNIVAGKSIRQLISNKDVVVSFHSSDQLLAREGSNEAQDVINLVQRIVACDTILKAQYKGYTELSYTAATEGDPEHYKLPLSFKRRNTGNSYIKSVTVAFRNAPTQPMTTNKMGQSSDMQDLYRRLLEEQDK